MSKAILCRLLELSDIDADEGFCWTSDSIPVTKEDIMNALDQNVSGIEEPYGDIYKHRPDVTKDAEYHIRRVIYFIQHPDEISEVEVENPCFDGCILPACRIVDGYHRLFAAIILNLQTIDISYEGRKDVEDYIIGVSEIFESDKLI